MSRYLYLDIETIPAQRPDVLDEIRSTIKPPGNIKKAESIAEWMKNESEVAADEAYRKTGLDGAYGQICVIGFALDDAEPRTVWSPEWGRPECETELLKDFTHVLSDLIPANRERMITVVGHNVASFDLRFLMQRSIVNSIRPHRIIASAAQAKPWEADKVFDTMVQWSGIGNRISLDKLCKALSIPTPKTGITGAQVWDEVQAGRIDDVAAYCQRDIAATRAVHRRLTFQETMVNQHAFEDFAA